MSYFRQVSVFWRLISKSLLEWFLLIICKEHTLTRSTNLFSRSHLALCFWLRREQLSLSNWQKQLPEVSYKKDVFKNFAIFTGKHLYWSLFLLKLPALRPATLLEGDSNTGVFLMRSFYQNLIWRMLLNWL